MMLSRLDLFLGDPISFNGVFVYSPCVKEVAKIGLGAYSLNLVFATFNKNKINDIFGLKQEETVLDPKDNYISIVSMLSGDIASLVANSIAFFLKENVYFNHKDKSFYTENGLFLNEDNCRDFVEIIKVSNCLQEEKKQNMHFESEKARELYERYQKIEEEKRKRDGFELKDILSIICNGRDNGINVFNVRDLTMYQVYEHWERLNLKESHSRLVQVWANGLLQDSSKLQEWMVKTKL